MQKLLLLLLIAIALLAAYSSYQFWNKKINPRKSVTHFVSYLLVNLATVFIIVFIFGFIVITFKEFLFSK